MTDEENYLRIQELVDRRVRACMSTLAIAQEGVLLSLGHHARPVLDAGAVSRLERAALLCLEQIDAAIQDGYTSGLSDLTSALTPTMRAIIFRSLGNHVRRQLEAVRSSHVACLEFHGHKVRPGTFDQALAIAKIHADQLALVLS